MNVNDLYQQFVATYQKQNYKQILSNIERIQGRLGFIAEFEILFGLCCTKLSLHAQSLTHFRYAYKASPDNQQAQLLLATALNDSGEVSKAYQLCQKMTDDTVPVLSLKASLEKQLTNFVAAKVLLLKILKIEPNNFYALYTLSVIHRELGDMSDALETVERIKISNTDIILLKAGILFDLGEYKQTEECLEEELVNNPSSAQLHDTINQFHWARNNNLKYLNSYQLSAPLSEPVQISYIKNLILSNQFDRASIEIDRVLETQISNPNYIHLKGVLLSRTNHWQEAEQYFRRAAIEVPLNQRFSLDLAIALIYRNEFSAAETRLEHALSISPLNQEVWAYLGFVWQNTNSSKFDWLYDKGKLIDIDMLDVPKGFSCLPTYLTELRDYIKELHRSKSPPLDQSVRNGTQTVGNLIHTQHPLIKAFKEVMNKRVVRYLQKIPSDPTHPLRQQVKSLFVYSGSWSVLLNQQGHHTNHVHPMGWISGPTYIDVPSQINASDSNQMGWVTFGKTSLDHEKERVMKSVCPVMGESILFPSYLWHGTNPLSDVPMERLTISLDIKGV